MAPAVVTVAVAAVAVAVAAVAVVAVVAVVEKKNMFYDPENRSSSFCATA